MKVKVKLRLLKINDELELELKENSTVDFLLKELALRYGDELKELIGDAEKGFRVIVMSNGEIMKYNETLKNNQELCLILPVAGG